MSKTIDFPCGDKVEYDVMIEHSTVRQINSQEYFAYICLCGQEYYIPKKQTLILTDEDMKGMVTDV